MAKDRWDWGVAFWTMNGDYLMVWNDGDIVLIDEDENIIRIPLAKVELWELGEIIKAVLDMEE